MSKQYYDSALTGAEIDKALKAVSDLVTQNNNGKILTIENGKFAAKKPSEIAGTAVLEALNVSANGDYYPESGVDGFDEVHVTVPSYPEPTGTIQIASNGTVNVKEYASAEVSVPSGITAADEGKVVKNGALVAQTARATEITENGTYDTTENNFVTVNVSGGGGGSSDWPFMDDITEGGTGFVANVSGSEPLDVNDLPANVRTFYNNYARTPKPTTYDYDIDITEDDAGLTLAELKVAHKPQQLVMEYYGNVYDNTAMIAALGLVLLGDFSQGGADTGNALSDSISQYSAVILQGIYNKQRTSGYNTSMLYVDPYLSTAYWAGMKDRNTSYDCRVTFTDDQTVSLTGNRQVIIYGVP